MTIIATKNNVNTLKACLKMFRMFKTKRCGWTASEIFA